MSMRSFCLVLGMFLVWWIPEAASLRPAGSIGHGHLGVSSLRFRPVVAALPRTAAISTALAMARKKKKVVPTTPEVVTTLTLTLTVALALTLILAPHVQFSRLLNVDQVPGNRPVMCRLLAKESERAALAHRFDMPTISYFRYPCAPLPACYAS